MTRTTLEALYRRYFLEIRKFDPFPMQLTYENVMDFAEWLLQKQCNHDPTDICYNCAPELAEAHPVEQK